MKEITKGENEMKDYNVKLDEWHDLKVTEMEDGHCYVTYYEDGKALGHAERYADIETVEFDYGIKIK